MIKLKNIVDESKYSELHELYHFTSIDSLYTILTDRALKIPQPEESTNVDTDNEVEDEVTYFSFCRNKDWIRRKTRQVNGIKIDCFIAVNANKLSSRYRIEPYNFWKRTNKTTRYFEFEERVIVKGKYGTISDLDKYIKYIGLKKHVIEWMPTNAFIDMILKHFYFHKIYTNEIIDFIKPDEKRVTRDMAVKYIHHLLDINKTKSDILAALIEKQFEYEVKLY